MKEEPPNWDHIRECLCWKPLDVVKHTIAATTQYAKNVLRLPMRQHFKSRFPSLNVRRLREPYATDTFFSSERSIDGLCATVCWETKLFYSSLWHAF